MVFYTTVVEYVASYLRAPFNFLLTGFHLSLFSHAVLKFFIIQDRTQLAHCIFTVLGLVAGFRIFNQDFFFLARIRVFELIAQTNTGLHLVHILTTGTTGTESIPRNIGNINVHLNSIIYQRSDKDRSERSHALTLRIVRRYTYQTMHTVFSFQVSISIITRNFDGTSFDTCFITFLQVGDHSFITIGFGVTQIHTHQHACPVLAFRTTCTGVDFQHTVHLVGFITKHIFQFKLINSSGSLGISFVYLFLRNKFVFVKVESQLQLFR